MSEPTFQALGFSETSFDPAKPGRLCRGRERWIQPWPDPDPSPDQERPSLTRLVITGAEFKDDSARDALRGVQAAGVELDTLVQALFPDERMVIFTEDGHPADIPDGAHGVELYPAYRAGGRVSHPRVRWYKEVTDRSELGVHLVFDGQDERCRGVVIVPDHVDMETLAEKLYPLVGMSTLDSPPAHYQPAALPDLLDIVHGVVVLHRDKHGTAVGIYTRESLGLESRIEAFAEDQDCLLVPFAIPPMLARWDRALSELRQTWETEREEPFPVPVGENGGWERRGRRRRKNRKDDPTSAADSNANETPDATEAQPDSNAPEATEATPSIEETAGEDTFADDLDALLLVGSSTTPAPTEE